MCNLPGLSSSMTVPSARNASTMRVQSRDFSAPVSIDGPLASADSTSARFVSDLEPGTSTFPRTAVAAVARKSAVRRSPPAVPSWRPEPSSGGKVCGKHSYGATRH